MRGLIGSTGFVGGALAAQRDFDRLYNSKTIAGIAGQSFDLVVCAGAPATMWAANADPDADAANIQSLIASLSSARIDKLVLISTVAVFDDLSAGYTESTAAYEAAKAYGRNRRWLEVEASARFDCHILRLPALFGPGLKKNFIFDLLNPIPSFVAAAKFDDLIASAHRAEAEALHRAFAFDASKAMWSARREILANPSVGAQVRSAFDRIGFTARDFTNSESRFQFYNVQRLAGDIETCLQHGIPLLNLCSEPWRARDIHMALTGAPFDCDRPARIDENVCSEYGAVFGAGGPYLFSADEVLEDLRTFFKAAGFKAVGAR